MFPGIIMPLGGHDDISKFWVIHGSTQGSLYPDRMVYA